MLLPESIGLTTHGAARVGSGPARVMSSQAGVGRPAFCQGAFRRDFVHADARCVRSAADERHAALFEDFLQLAALAKWAMKHRKNHVGRMIEARQIRR